MLGSQKFSNENSSFYTQKEREEYERQQAINLAKNTSNLFVKSLGYWFMWLFTSALTGTVLNSIFKIGNGMSFFIGLFIGFLIFKFPYVKEHPYKSTIMICFIFGLFIVAFPQSS